MGFIYGLKCFVSRKSAENLFPNFWLTGPWKSNAFTRNETQEQHSLLDTRFDYIFYFGSPGKYLY